MSSRGKFAVRHPDVCTRTRHPLPVPPNIPISRENTLENQILLGTNPPSSSLHPSSGSFSQSSVFNGDEYDRRKLDERYWENPQTPAAAASSSHHLLSCESQIDFKSESELQGLPIFSPNHQQLHLIEDDHLAPFTTSVSEAQAKQEMLAYQALCQAELLRSEKTPHRTQFQRENHILAERQRREEMNEKFIALKQLHVQQKDKASIVGETINYVLELEKKLKELQTTANGRNLHRHKRRAQYGKTSVLKLSCESSLSQQDLLNPPVQALRILATLEDCKVHIIQSNIATLGDHAVLFFTVEVRQLLRLNRHLDIPFLQITPAASGNTDDLVAALELAASRPQ